MGAQTNDRLSSPAPRHPGPWCGEEAEGLPSPSAFTLRGPVGRHILWLPPPLPTWGPSGRMRAVDCPRVVPMFTKRTHRVKGVRHCSTAGHSTAGRPSLWRRCWVSVSACACGSIRCERGDVANGSTPGLNTVLLLCGTGGPTSAPPEFRAKARGPIIPRQILLRPPSLEGWATPPQLNYNCMIAWPVVRRGWRGIGPGSGQWEAGGARSCQRNAPDRDGGPQP
jgi:hypothetical protein